jgi:hypothetical protein
LVGREERMIGCRVVAGVVVHKRIDITVPERLYWVQSETWCATCNPARNDL